MLISKKRYDAEINRAYDMGYSKAVEEHRQKERDAEIFRGLGDLGRSVKRLEEKMKCVCSGFCEDGESCRLNQNQSDKSFR